MGHCEKYSVRKTSYRQGWYINHLYFAAIFKSPVSGSNDIFIFDIIQVFMSQKSAYNLYYTDEAEGW